MKTSKLIKSAALLFRGFTFATADEWFYLESIKKYKRRNNIGMSDKDIFSLLPFDAKFDKLFGDPTRSISTPSFCPSSTTAS